MCVIIENMQAHHHMYMMHLSYLHVLQPLETNEAISVTLSPKNLILCSFLNCYSFPEGHIILHPTLYDVKSQKPTPQLSKLENQSI